MARTASRAAATRSKGALLNLRLDPELKEQFAQSARAANKPLAEVLRELMRAYVKVAQEREFAREARLQSQKIAASADDAEVTRWMEDVTSGEGWK